MNRDRFLRVLGADPQRWMQRYDLQPFSSPCSGCGAERTVSIPIASGKLRGLIAPLCSCGSLDAPYCWMSTQGDSLSDLFAR